MEPAGERPQIEVEGLPTMEWMLERLVADGELRYLRRNPDRRDELPKRYDIAPHVAGERREELIALLRDYTARQE